MSRTTKIVLTSAVGGLAAIVVVAGALWYFVLRSDPPPPPSLPDRDVATSESADDETQTDEIDGSWTIVPASGEEEVYVGYRVDELLAGDTVRNTAVGRTIAVTGTMAIADTRVNEVEVVADLRELASDQGGRDNYLSRSSLETNQFPEARFVLTEPIELAAVPTPGEAMTVTATGDLTLRDVTRQVSIELEASWNGEVIDVSGQLPIAFADYDIATPNVTRVLEIDDHGLLEIQLVFART